VCARGAWVALLGGPSTSPLDVSKAVALAAVAVALAAGGLVWANRPAAPLPVDAKADLLVVEKAARRLSLYSHGALVGSYPVSLGRAPVGTKVREGDRRTPEGRYIIDRHNPHSAFHLALHVSYPSAQDLARAQAAGYSPGGEVMVHGMRNGLGWLGRAHLLVDWTSGCVAVTNAEIEQIYQAVPDGTPIEFRP
jgi:murein L,D-transpeptidase YafK